jgi:hypothetical protein
LAGHVEGVGEKRNACRILVKKPEGKRSLGRQSGWVILKWILERWDGMDWIDLAQDREQWRALVNTVMNHQVPYNVKKFFSSWTTGCFSRRSRLHGVS